MTRFRGQYRIESARLPGWDYAAPGAYFITICTRGRAHAFGGIKGGIMHLSAIGEIAHRFWQEIPQHFPRVTVDAFVVMPDHIHGIIILPAAETRHVASLRPDVASLRPDVASLPDVASPRGLNIAAQPGPNGAAPSKFGPLKPGSVSKIVQAYKAAVTRWCRLNGHPDFAWQRLFHDRIIRDGRELHIKRRYIRLNPSRWPK